MKRQRFLFLILIIPLISACDFLKTPGEIIDSILNMSNSSSSEESLLNNSSDKSKESNISSYSNEESSEEISSDKSVYIPVEGEYDLNAYYNGYYKNFSWENGADLISKLHDLMHEPFYALAYGWDVNEKADRSLDDFEYLDVVYSEKHISKDPSTRTTSWNKEHAFCASLMTGTSTSNATQVRGRATDYHNLFASEAKANSARGNTNYGEIPSKNSDKGYINGSNKYGQVFEPGVYDKGRIARALFYMATMYSVDNELPNTNLPKLTLKDGLVIYPNNGQGYTEYAHGSLSDLLDWSRYTVDRLEYQHNEQVYNAQRNRNAFVDFPDLVEYAFGDLKDEPGELKKVLPSAEYLHINEESIANYAISSAKREYTIGEEFHYSDIKLVAVNNDFSTTPATEFTTDIADGTVLTEGTKTITIHTELNDIKYEIEVGKFYFKNAEYSHTFKSSEIKKGTDVTLDGLKLNIDWANNNATVGNVDTNGGRGVQIGNATYPTGAITINVKDKLNKISGIYFKCGVASGVQGVVKFYIDEVLLNSSTVTFISGSAYEAICEIQEKKSGNIKIVFEVNTKASYIHTLAIDYANE